MRSFSISVLAGLLLISGQTPATAQITPPDKLNRLLQDSFQALQRKDWATARQAAMEVTAVDSKNQLAWSYLGQAYEHLPDFTKAVESYQRLIVLDPRHKNAYNNLGWCYRRLGRVDDAIASYRKQLEVTPGNSYATYNLALALGSQGQWPEAVTFAKQAVDAAPTVVARWAFLGKAQIRTGHVDDARASFDRALTLPHRPMDENNIAYMLAETGHDLDRSWQLITNALESSTQDMCGVSTLFDGDLCTDQLRSLPLMLDTAGWVLFRQGKMTEAAQYLESAFAITPNSVNQIHLAIVKAKEGEVEEAVRMFALARLRADFGRADSEEAMRELTLAAGNKDKFQAILDRIKVHATPRVDARAIVLVDSNGKVLKSEIEGPTFPGATDLLKSARLPAILWPGFALRTIRSVEFINDQGHWLLADSYVGLTPPPPPCSTPTRPIEVTRMTPVALSISCEATL